MPRGEVKTQRHEPERCCIVCGEKFSKAHMSRMVMVSKEPVQLFVDSTGKMNGRGAYICSDKCWSGLDMTHIQRAFRRRISPEVLRELKHQRETVSESR